MTDFVSTKTKSYCGDHRSCHHLTIGYSDIKVNQILDYSYSAI